MNISAAGAWWYNCCHDNRLARFHSGLENGTNVKLLPTEEKCSEIIGIVFEAIRQTNYKEIMHFLYTRSHFFPF